MFDHILVPLDGSSLAECVLPHTVALAQAFASRVTLLRVLSCPSSSDPESRPIDPLDWEMGKTEAEIYLDDIVTRLRETGLEAQSVLLEGRPAQRITEFAPSHDVDLIVLSSHGQSGLSGWNVSSVVQKVLMRAHVSMMLVRAYQPGAQDLASLRYRQLLVPLDGSQRAECVFSPATKLASLHDGRLLAVHVVRRPEMPHRVPLRQKDIDLAERLTDRKRQAATEYLEDLQSRLSGEVETQLLVSDDVAIRLHELVEEEDVDLVVVSAHGYSGRAKWPYGSVTTGFINYGSTPLLIVQDLAPDEVEPTRAAMATQEHPGH